MSAKDEQKSSHSPCTTGRLLNRAGEPLEQTAGMFKPVPVRQAARLAGLSRILSTQRQADSLPKQSHSALPPECRPLLLPASSTSPEGGMLQRGLGDDKADRLR